jgi:hypothetical protein
MRNKSSLKGVNAVQQVRQAAFVAESRAAAYFADSIYTHRALAKP